MPDQSWICNRCGEKNPPYTEACRNCYESAPNQATLEQPQHLTEGATFEELVRPGQTPYLLILAILLGGCVAASVNALLLADHLTKGSIAALLLMLLSVWQIRAYLRNETVLLKYTWLPSTSIDSSSGNKELRGLATFFWLMFYLLAQWLLWR